MKKIVYNLSILFMLVLLFSCSDDFLEREPLGTLAETVFYNEEGLDALLIGTYAIMDNAMDGGFRYAHTPTNWMYGSVVSDDGYKGSDAGDVTPVKEMETWSTLPTNPWLVEKWIWTFNGVTRTNNILRILKGTNDILPETAAQIESTAMASAGATLRAIIALGKFHGVIEAATPMGWRSTLRRLSA